MRISDRISKLERWRKPPSPPIDFSKLDDDELRLIAALPVSPNHQLDLSGLSPVEMDKIHSAMAKIGLQI